MRCADCKHYVKKADELHDECHHEKAVWKRDRGIRKERCVIAWHACDSMLAGICINHQLFEAEPKPDTQLLRDEYPDKYAGLKVDAIRNGDL